MKKTVKITLITVASFLVAIALLHLAYIAIARISYVNNSPSITSVSFQKKLFGGDYINIGYIGVCGYSVTDVTGTAEHNEGLGDYQIKIHIDKGATRGAKKSILEKYPFGEIRELRGSDGKYKVMADSNADVESFALYVGSDEPFSVDYSGEFKELDGFYEAMGVIKIKL